MPKIISIDVGVMCDKCGALLSVRVEYHAREPVFFVGPCSHCMSIEKMASYKAGFSDGHDKGYDDGFGDGVKDVKEQDGSPGR